MFLEAFYFKTTRKGRRGEIDAYLQAMSPLFADIVLGSFLQSDLESFHTIFSSDISEQILYDTCTPI